MSKGEGEVRNAMGEMRSRVVLMSEGKRVESNLDTVKILGEVIDNASD